MALNNSNPFDEILTTGDRDAGVPFAGLERGISPKAPEDINPFDAIGYEAPPEPSYQKVGDYRGAEILQDEGGKWYSSSQQGIIELPEEVKAQVGAEIGGLEEPWIDPTTVGFAAAGVGGRLAAKAGARGLELLGRAATAGGVAAAAEYPIGIVTEAIGEKHPELAPYVNIGLGILSGVTVENIIERAIIGKGITPTARAVNKYITELRTGAISDDISSKVASDITEEVKVKQPDIVDRIHGERAEEIHKMQEKRKAELRKGFAEPKPSIPKEPEFKDYKAEIKGRFPEADADDIAYVSREVAQDFKDIRDPRTAGNADAWERFAETGEEVGPRGGPEAFNFGKENFETKMRNYLEFKISVDEAAVKAPEEVNAFDEIMKPPKPTYENIPRVENIEQLKAERAIPDQTKRVVYQGDKDFTLNTIKSAVKESGEDITGPTKLYRAIFPRDKDFKPGYLQPNPEHPHTTHTGEDVYATWWTSDPIDAIDIAKGKAAWKGEDVEIITMNAADLPQRSLIQNVEAEGEFGKVWIGITDDLPLEKTSIRDLTSFEEGARLYRKEKVDEINWGDIETREPIPSVGGERPEILQRPGVQREGIARGPAERGLPEVAAARAGRGIEGVAAKDRVGPAVSRPEPELAEGIPLIRPTKPGDVQAGSLAYGMPLPKQAASINLERMGGDYDAKKVVLDTSDRYKGQIDEARRGKITHDAMRELEGYLGMTEGKLLKRRKGRALNAEEALGARDILLTSAENMVLLQKKVALNPTEENLALFTMAMSKHAAIQAEVSGVATEAGRALSAHRIQSAKNARIAKNFEKMLDIMGGRRNTEKIARYFSTIDPSDQAAVNKFIMEMSEAKFADKVFEAWINGLLSGPQTHVVNTTSNTITFLSGIPERATGATLDLMRAGITQTPRERFFGEIPEHIYGAWHGMKEGVRAGMKAFATEIPTEDAMKLEIPRQMAIKGKKGRIIRLPGRSLMAMDEFFKAINYRAELHSLAFRQAAKEGLKGDARVKRIAEIVMDPPRELKEKATEEMLYRVFQKELGPSGKALTKLRNVTPGLRYVIPFLKTPTNIAKFGLERTPLSLARYPSMFKKLMKGDIKGADITDEMAKTIMGSMIGLGTFMYAKEGNITGGGPKNKADREAKYRTGWQPYSIKVGNRYYSYGRLEPLGMVMGITADASDIWDEMNKEEQENIAALIALSVTKNLTSKTFMKGLADAMNATTDPARYGEKWVQGFIASGVPSIAAATTRALGPELKDAQTIIDKIKSRIPGAAEGIFPKRDIWGQAIERDLSGVLAMTSPIYISEGKGSKADQEVVRLGVRIGKPSRKIRGQELTPEQYDRLMTAAGNEAKKRVDQFVGQKSYDKMKDEVKAKIIKKRYEHAIGFERRKLWNEIRQKNSYNSE